MARGICGGGLSGVNAMAGGKRNGSVPAYVYIRPVMKRGVNI